MLVTLGASAEHAPQSYFKQAKVRIDGDETAILIYDIFFFLFFLILFLNFT